MNSNFCPFQSQELESKNASKGKPVPKFHTHLFRLSFPSTYSLSCLCSSHLPLNMFYTFGSALIIDMRSFIKKQLSLPLSDTELLMFSFYDLFDMCVVDISHIVPFSTMEMLCFITSCLFLQLQILVDKSPCQHNIIF